MRAPRRGRHRRLTVERRGQQKHRRGTLGFVLRLRRSAQGRLQLTRSTGQRHRAVGPHAKARHVGLHLIVQCSQRIGQPSQVTQAFALLEPQLGRPSLASVQGGEKRLPGTRKRGIQSHGHAPHRNDCGSICLAAQPLPHARRG